MVHSYRLYFVVLKVKMAEAIQHLVSGGSISFISLITACHNDKVP